MLENWGSVLCMDLALFGGMYMKQFNGILDTNSGFAVEPRKILDLVGRIECLPDAY
jgi:hypothetical protein